MGKKIVLVLFVGSIVSACASSRRAPAVSAVPTTSATTLQCKNAHSDCWLDADCCSDNCDYELHFCH